ncbi:MAG TPA: flippase-like domain-containing protein, partial [Burkholderiales bacterium]|nr:flippase-like domain-containing protein [Burkholderiales bacterium]
RVAPASWRLEQKLAGFVALFEHLGTCLSPRVFGLGVLAAILAYSAQALALLYIVKALSGDVSAPAVFLSFFVSTLGGAASMLPAGLGSMEAALVALLSHFGMPLPSAVAATVLIRLATLWFVVAMGLICLTWVHLRHHTPEGARAVQL